METAEHKLPKLDYAYDALEPHIDAATMSVHHGKHHASYVAKLNDALEKAPDLNSKSLDWLLTHLDEVPSSVRTAIRNNGGGHLNHTMFWQLMSPSGGGDPVGPLADAIARDFGDADEFRSAFEAQGAKVFGSGWVWLTSDDDGKLSVVTTGGHDNPIMDGLTPILVNDVWEHAYYLKHQNRRPDYLSGWWAVTDWRAASDRYADIAKA